MQFLLFSFLDEYFQTDKEPYSNQGLQENIMNNQRNCPKMPP